MKDYFLSVLTQGKMKHEMVKVLKFVGHAYDASLLIGFVGNSICNYVLSVRMTSTFTNNQCTHLLELVITYITCSRMPRW